MAARSEALRQAYMTRVAADAQRREEEEEEEERPATPPPLPPPQRKPIRDWRQSVDFTNLIANSVFDHIRGEQPAVTLPALEAYLRDRCGETDERIRKMVADLDLDGNGSIDKEEWQRAWADGVVSALRP